MYTFILGIHVAACILMILVVLLQAGRGAGLAVFGGGGSEQLFNTPTTTGFMKQLTTGLAVTFAITSLLLTLMHGRTGMSSVTNSVAFPSAPPPAPTSAAQPPAAPAPSGSPAAVPAPSGAAAPTVGKSAPKSAPPAQP